MRRERVWIAAIAALFAVLTFGSAESAQAEGEFDTGGFGAFWLKGTNGYTIDALASSEPGFKHGSVLLFVVRRHESALYFAHAKVTATTIDARLGGVGKISVQFEAEGKPKTVHSQCSSEDPITYQPGEWVGTVEFNGEEGFTRVSATSARARISPFARGDCSLLVEGIEVGPKFRGARLHARSETKRTRVFVEAIQNHHRGRLKLEAAIEERGRGLRVRRVVERSYPGGGFDFDPLLRSATLRPPAPFAGIGIFRRHAKPANRWTGNLSVDFPGRSNVHLTGSKFTSTLAHARLTRERVYTDG